MIPTLVSRWIGTYYLLYFAGFLAALALVLVAAHVFRRRLPRRVRLAARLLVSVLFVRLVLFDNPATLGLYQWALRSEGSLGMRQYGVLDLEVRKYRRDLHPALLANLAVGSSQVGAIFYNWVSDPPQPLGVYSLAGMKPLDYVLNEEAIAAHNPTRVILYVSGFDMTGSPELFSLPLAPPRPSQIWPMYAHLRAAGLTAEEIAPSFHGFIASQLFPEYRYSFVYRALLRKWLGAAPSPPAASQQRLPEFSSYFDPQWLDYNFLFFREFLAFCRSRGIEVVVSEGQINPTARTPAIEALNTTVRSRIVELRRQFPNLRYVPAAEIYEFAPAEYHDTVHVLPEAARRYTAKLSAYLAR